MVAAAADSPRQWDEGETLRTVTATAPVRVCDIGGWTDTWFSRHGTVLNIAVTPGVEVGVRAVEGGSVPHRFTLEVTNFGDRYGFEPGEAPGRHPLLEAVIDAIGAPDGLALHIRIASDVPAGSSTGTSAAVAVALIGALDALAPRPRNAHEVARAAHRIEVERLGLQSGVQDQLCAAFGGVNFIEVGPYPDAVRTGLVVPDPALRELEQQLVLVHLGRPHRSSEIHERVITRLLREGEGSTVLEELRGCAVMARDAALAGDLEGFGRAMTRNTDAQRRLHGELVSAQAESIIAIAASHGAFGWKVNGAGGHGGSLSLLCGPDPMRRQAMELALHVADPVLRFVPTRLSRDGLRVRRSTPGVAAT
jgi:D-glycero-alpha-D-manno-heptose-7-phosphate kinase